MKKTLLLELKFILSLDIKKTESIFIMKTDYTLQTGLRNNHFN